MMPMRPMRLICSLVALMLAGLSFAGIAAASDEVSGPGWPTAGGDYRRSGQSEASTADNFGALVWTFRAEDNGITIQDDWFEKRPLVVDGRGTVYFEDGGSIYAVRNGTLAWQYHAADQDVPLFLGSTISPPAISPHGTVYVGGHDKFLHALDRDGALLWKYDAGNFIDSIPAVGRDGTIYVATSPNSGDEYEELKYYLHAVDPDGTMKWKVETGPCQSSSVALADDGTVYLVIGASSDTWNSKGYRLAAVGPDGTIKWAYSLGNMSFQPPAVAPDGSVVLLTYDDLSGAHDNFLLKVRPNGTLAWKFDVGNAFPFYNGLHGTAPAIARDGTIYFGCVNGVGAVSADGAYRWRYDIDRGMVSGLAISREGTIHFGSVGHGDPDRGNRGYLYALSPDGTLDWRVLVGNYPLSDTAIGPDGTIYVAAGGEVWALSGGVSPEMLQLLKAAIVGVVLASIVLVAVALVRVRRRGRRPSDL